MFYSRVWTCMVMALALAGTIAEAQQVAPLRVNPSALLAIDQNRLTVVERIVGDWGEALSKSGAGLTQDQLREILNGLRADHLLAASLAGSPSGLRDVLARSLSSTTVKSPRLQPQALGDTSDDLVYTPVSPCRLFDTRPAQGGLGVMTPNVRRTYGATTPVANQGGPGGCNAATGAAVALIQIGTLTPSGNGYLQGGAQGVASFPNALILYQAGDQYGTAVAMPLNVANGTFDVEVQFAATDLYGDLLGYFQRPKNYGGTHVITGIDATDSGGSDNTASGNYSTVGGGANHTASGFAGTVAGGFGNTASGAYSTVAGGSENTASGAGSFAAGSKAVVSHNNSFLWCDGHTTCNSQADKDFIVVAQGGIAMYALTGGCTLSGAATQWFCSSDRNLKENFTALNALDVLRRVSAMPVMRWNEKAVPGIEHVGPTAQDFRAAFGLGADDLHIGTGDISGVALVAIQGLNAKVESAVREKDRQLGEQAATIREQQRQLAELSERVQKAEALAADVVALKLALAELQRTRAIVAVKYP